MDRRDRMAQFGRDYFPSESNVDLSKMTVTFSMEEEDGTMIEHCLPLKMEVCESCHGTSKHVNPSIDAHGISPEEFDEDPDFAEDYFEGRLT